MKKLSQILTGIIFAFVVAFSAVGCGDTGVAKIEVKENTLQTEYDLGEAINYSAIRIKVTQNNGKVKEIKIADCEYNTIKTTVPGEKTLTITYKGKSTTFNLVVNNYVAEGTVIIGYEEPEFIRIYNNNIKEKTNTVEEPRAKETEFKNREDGYYAGSQNSFYFVPNISALSPSGEPFVIEAPDNLFSSFEIWNVNTSSEATTQITGAELEEIAEIDAEKHAINFKEDAVGNSYNIKVKSLDTDIFEESAKGQEFDFTVKVIEAWNAYSPVDIARLNNTDYSKGVWADFFSANSITEEEVDSIKNMIIHKDMKISDQDLSRKMFYNSGDPDINSNPRIKVGSLRDDVVFYHHYVEDGNEFELIGNYFTLDFSGISYITYDPSVSAGMSADSIFSDSRVFFFSGNVKDTTGEEERLKSVESGKTTVKNFNFIGNAERKADENTLKYSGGIQLYRNQSAEFVAENTISKNFITTLVHHNEFDNETGPKFEFKDSKIYDNYSTGIWTNVGGTQNKITNSEFKRSGGPIIILADKKDKFEYEFNGENWVAGSTTPMYTEIVADKDTVIENYVGGTEPWFALNAASAIVNVLQAVNGLVPTADNTVSLTNSQNMFNMIALVMPNELREDFADGVYQVKSKFTWEQASGDSKILDGKETANNWAMYKASTAPIFENPQMTNSSVAAYVIPAAINDGGGVYYGESPTLVSGNDALKNGLFKTSNSINLYLPAIESGNNRTYIGLMLELFSK